MMKQDLSQQQNQPQNLALAGVVMILTPVFFPHLFAPLSRASPSILSVRLTRLASLEFLLWH